MKKFLLYNIIIIGILLIPPIPLYIKGMLGLIFVAFICIKIGYKSGLATAIILTIVRTEPFLFSSDMVDYKKVIAIWAMSSVLYFVTAIFIGKTADKMKSKNIELQNEISKRVKTEEALNDKIRFLQSLMDTIPTPIFVKDLDFRYIGCNHAYERDFDVEEKDLIGKRLDEMLDHTFADTHHIMDLELVNSQVNQVVYETTDVFANNNLRSCINIKTLLTDERGAPQGIIGVITDITDRKESEHLKKSLIEEKQMIDEILNYERLKTEFFSNISHELRTPLNVVLGAVQLLEMYSQNGQFSMSQGKVMKNVYSIKQNCLRLLRLLNNLIDITKIDAKSLELYLQNKNIVSIVEDATLSTLDYANNKGIALEFDTEIEEKIMACDEEKIERIMLNLLSNAIKFTPNGGNIYVNVYDRGNHVCIEVRDTGIGIPQDRQNEIFERFSQINSMFTRFHEGSGIGLSIVKDLVKMHDGEIKVESEPGQGTRFYVILPCSVTDEAYVDDCIDLERKAGVEGIELEFSDIYSERVEPYIVAI